MTTESSLAAEHGARPTRFAFRAVRPDGSTEDGFLDAADATAAAAVLGDRGMLALELRFAATTPFTFGRGRRAIAIGDLAIGLRILGELLDAGLPLSRALSALADIAPQSWTGSLPAIRDAIRQGRTLASAIEIATLGAPPVILGVLRAGEAGSGLAQAVMRAADLLEQTVASRQALRSALAYPALLAASSSVAVVVLVGIVIPRFARMLEDIGQALPASTQLVLALAGIARDAALPGIAVVVGALIAHRVWTRNHSGRTRWHGMLLGMPIVGPLRHAAVSSRVCTALAGLLESGVPIASALPPAADAGGDDAVRERVLRARERVLSGERLSRALVATLALTPITIQLVRAGEESGRLASMLTHAARLERDRALTTTKSIVRLIEPALILGFGALVALVAAALLQALYSIRPT